MTKADAMGVVETVKSASAIVRFDSGAVVEVPSVKLEILRSFSTLESTV